MAVPVLRWYVLERGGVRYEVQAAGKEQAAWYLGRCLREPRPYEPGHAIRILPPRPQAAVARERGSGHDASPTIESDQEV